MDKRISHVLAFLLSFIMIMSSPMSSLAQDSADRPVSEPGVRVTAPGSPASEQNVQVTTPGSPASEQDVQVTAPGNAAAYDQEESAIPAEAPLILANDTHATEEIVGRSDSHAHGKGLIKPYVVVEPISTDDIAASSDADSSEEPLVGSSEIATTPEEFAELYAKASNEAASKWETTFIVKYQCSYDDNISTVFNEQLYPLTGPNLFPHNGNPTEGDYAKWTYGGAGYSVSDYNYTSDGLVMSFKTSVEYYP